MTIKRLRIQNTVTLAKSSKSSWVTVLKTGNFYDWRYGDFEVTQKMLNQMVKNFNNNIFKQDIYFDRNHIIEDGVAGTIVQLKREGNRLRAQVEWSDFGLSVINDQGFVYVSAEFEENYMDNETKETYGVLLKGAALTPRPVIKGMDKVQLSEGDVHSPYFIEQHFYKELTTMPFVNKLKADQGFKKLSQTHQAHFISLAEKIEESDTAQEDAILLSVKTLSEMPDVPPEAPIHLNIDQGNTLSESDIKAAITQYQKELAEAQKADAKKLSEALEANTKTFSDTLGKELGESAADVIAEHADAIQGTMSEAQVITFAKHIAKAHKQSVVAKKLGDIGFTGNPFAGNAVTAPAVVGHVDKMLSQTNQSRSLVLSDEAATKNNPFVAKLLAEFDRQHHTALSVESTMLSEGATSTQNIAVPVSFQRAVLREAVADTNVLALVAATTNPSTGQTTDIYYEDEGEFAGDAKVFEGMGIPNSDVSVKSESVYLEPIKLAIEVTNEVLHFSANSALDWEAFARLVALNGKLLRQIIVRKITNEMIRAADSYNAMSVSNEDASTQLTGAQTMVKTAHYPVVRQKQVYSMNGQTIGNMQNPITVVVDGNSMLEYIPGGNQDAGTYWALNPNLGYIMFVNEKGESVAPGNVSCTLSYDYATNATVWDLTVPSGVSVQKHANGLLRAIGSAKARLASTSFIEPNFMLMGHELNNMATDAENFTASGAVNGNTLSMQGNLESVKGIMAYSTNAITDLGETRILLGLAGNTHYTVSKTYSLGNTFEDMNEHGQPTGKKKAYGEEYSAIHTPSIKRKNYASIIVVDKSAR